MKNRLILFMTLLLLLGCSYNSNPSDVIVLIEATGLSDEKLALNNTATFTSNVSGFDGDLSSLNYRWVLSNEHGELTDGFNSLPNPTFGDSSMICVVNQLVMRKLQ